jgi:hypothetical protein
LLGLDDPPFRLGRPSHQDCPRNLRDVQRFAGTGVGIRLGPTQGNPTSPRVRETSQRANRQSGPDVRTWLITAGRRHTAECRLSPSLIGRHLLLPGSTAYVVQNRRVALQNDDSLNHWGQQLASVGIFLAAIRAARQKSLATSRLQPIGTTQTGMPRPRECDENCYFNRKPKIAESQ